MLAGLCPQTVFAESDVEVFYSKLKYILGLWSAEHDRLDIAPLVKTFTAMGKELKKVAEILSGHETGLREIHDIAIVSQLATILALDPEIGSRRQADRLIDSFRGDAGKLAHACLVAACDLKISFAWVGWLLNAAQALEAFLDPQMRSSSAEACGKRLERSKKRLKQKHRQNPSSA